MSDAQRAIRAAMDHVAQKRFAQAAAVLRRVLQKEPGHAEANYSLGQTLFQMSHSEQAAFYLERAVRLNPAQAVYRNNYGCVLSQLGKIAEAAEQFRESVRLDPGYVSGQVGLSMALLGLKEYDGSVEAARAAIRLAPGTGQAYNNACIALLSSGRVAEAVGVLREAQRRLEGASPDGTLLGALNYCHDADPRQVFEEHVRLGERIAESRRHIAGRGLRNAPEPERRLRVGYLSADFRRHSVAYFIEPVIGSHDRSRVEVACYSNVARADATTERLKGLADRWVDASRMSDDELDARLRADEVDILVELGGHTGGARLAAVAGKPAPVIVTYLGYPNTTGLAAVDYRLVDEATDPPRAGADALSVERLVRLPGCFLCFGPAPEAPAVADPPSALGGGVTFGSFNALAKLSDPCVEAWSRILGRVPGSRLVIKAESLVDASTRRRLGGRFEAHGIGGDRLELLAATASTAEHLGLYAGVDVGLDPFPYNGATTTCEALWMGVPVVTLEGRVHAGRVGTSILTALGLGELIAHSGEEYVDLAAGLAQDRPRLAALRGSMRGRMTRSGLCDGPRMARRLEEAYRAMWRVWCEGKRGGN